MKYSILMQHGVVLLPCPERVRSARNAEESTSCTLSTKIEPDSRGSSPGMTAEGVLQAVENAAGIFRSHRNRVRKISSEASVYFISLSGPTKFSGTPAVFGTIGASIGAGGTVGSAGK